MWPQLLKLSTIAVVILAGCWLVWLGLGGDEPASAPAIAPPPISTAFFVTPVSRPPTRASLPFVPIVEPREWRWWRTAARPCDPALRLSPLCDRPTPELVSRMEQ